MAVQSKQRECAQCKRLEQRIDELEAKIAKLGKNSSNSSKPPSSDIAKPGGRPKKPKKKRKQGAQPGHVRHQRTTFPENEIDRSWDYTIDTCPDCGHQVWPSDQPPRVLQQIDVVAPYAVNPQ